MKLGSVIHHCKRVVDEKGYVSYGAPASYTLRFMYLTCMPSSGDTKTMEHGEDVRNTWTLYAEYNAFQDVFSEGDILYLDGQKVDSGKDYGAGANAIVTSVRPQNKMIKIVAQKLDLQGRGMYGK